MKLFLLAHSEAGATVESLSLEFCFFSILPKSEFAVVKVKLMFGYVSS